jgi:uncharacterized protein
MVKSALALSAILFSGTALAAPESLSKVDTAKGEILLEIQANGVVMAKITNISIACDLIANGSTKAQAEQALEKMKQAMRQNFDAAGLDSATLDFSASATDTNSYGYAVEAADAAATATAVSDAAAAAGEAVTTSPDDFENPRFGRKQRVIISSGLMAEVEMARSLFAESRCDEDYGSTRRPNIVLSDVEVAKSSATVKAIEAAKAQAERYASALGKRVVRIIRVSETGAIREFLGAEADFFREEMGGSRNRQQPVNNAMPVTASISVDFVLGPK